MDRALLTQSVRAVHLAVVGGEDDHRVVPQALGVELVEDRRELQVDHPHAVDEVATARLPQVVAVFGDPRVGPLDAALVRVHAVGLLLEVVVEVRRQVDVVVAHEAERLRRMQLVGHRSVGVGLLLGRRPQVHDVVWVDQRGDEQPRPAVGALVAQPVDRLERGGAVEHRALQRRAEHVAPLLVVREAVGLERVLAPGHVGVEVPLALEGRVVAVLSQHRPYGRMALGQVIGPGEVRVVPQRRALGVQPGPHRRSRRRADGDRAVVAVERDPGFDEPAQGRKLDVLGQLHAHVPLVHAEDQDVRRAAVLRHRALAPVVVTSELILSSRRSRPGRT